MNRQPLFNICKENLTYLAYRIDVNGRLNLLDEHIHSENFYLHLLNLIFDYELENINTYQQNIGGIDLADNKNRIVVQVSATDTKQKIESTLDKIPPEYHGYYFKFIPIVADASHLKSKTYSNPHNMLFQPAGDIFDISHLLRVIEPSSLQKLKEIADFLTSELTRVPDPLRIQSNLADIINILSQDNLDEINPNELSCSFEIEEKIQYNNIGETRAFIDDFFVHHPRVEKLYAEYDRQGNNKSISVTGKFKSLYLHSDMTLTPDDRFKAILSEAINFIKESANYVPIPDEELELCVQILAVDAFIRCKIFKRPPRPTSANP